jgi:hypothetical protein
VESEVVMDSVYCDTLRTEIGEGGGGRGDDGGLNSGKHPVGKTGSSHL